MRPFQLPSLFLPVPLSDDVVVVFAKRSLLQTLAQSSLSITDPEQMWRLPVFHLFLPWKVYTRLFALNVTIYLLLHFSTPKTDDLHPKMLKIWPMCWWSAVLLYLRSPLLPAAWVEEIRPPLWSGKSLALVRAALRWIRSNSDTLSYFWASGAVFVWRGVCVSFVLLLDLQWVNHCSHFKLWRQRFLPMRHHSSRACVMWADQAIYVLPQKKLPFASYSFHIVPS